MRKNIGYGALISALFAAERGQIEARDKYEANGMRHSKALAEKRLGDIRQMQKIMIEGLSK